MKKVTTCLVIFGLYSSTCLAAPVENTQNITKQNNNFFQYLRNSISNIFATHKGDVAKKAMGYDMTAVPDWISRTDFSLNLSGKEKPTWSIETIQPILQTKETLKHTWFFQGRWAHQAHDNTINLGSGYRYLNDNQNYLFGINLFYDLTTRHNHKRLGVGGEVLGYYVTARANYYGVISKERIISDIGGIKTREKALNGWDGEAELPIPYLPWARFTGRYYWFKGKRLDNIHGNTLQITANISNNLHISTGRTEHNLANPKFFFKVEYSPGFNPSYEFYASDKIISNEAFIRRDLKSHTLDKVKRRNDFVIERTTSGSGGITIARGN